MTSTALEVVSFAELLWHAEKYENIRSAASAGAAGLKLHPKIFTLNQAS